MAILFVLWLLMSGIFKPLLIGLGVASVLLVVIVTKRMDAQDGDRIEIRLSPVRLTKYLIWLMMEIARSNWAVTKIVLARKMPIRQHLFTVPYTQKTDAGQVIFANSITLTPGTITVETEGGQFLVHALAYSSEVPASLANMCARVTETEKTEQI
ncbi:MAG: hypothetical protein COB40_05735 [Marinosulfonomonas sp.]|nr:MAG: hypothetical protein COB40_05735 [Marinosulfonomonas sp.]